MLQVLPESQGDILGVKVNGKFTNLDYKEFLIPRLEDLIKEHGKVRVLLYLDDDFQGLELDAIKSEPFGLRHKDDFQKIAVVGGSWRLRLELKMVAPFMAGEMRTFSREELPAAWAWIRA
ncbi:MAG TPA: STAS/SEC14 domain-containing protein [Desulfobaccales bacterium]|nr:STAS/SEC14 domain-containing protein [Desulfobaccales bacterium]